MAFLDRMEAAQHELHQGHPAPYKALWSQADDVTLAGGLEVGIRKGWPQVSQRLDQVAAGFHDGRAEIQRVAGSSDGSLGYVVQNEHLSFRNDQHLPVDVRYRVTMIFRREQGAWRIVHRHAERQVQRALAP